MFEYSAKIINVIDGDTVDALLDLGFNINHVIRVRLYGINTPETRTKNVEEKMRGMASKIRLKELIENKIVKIKTIKDSTEKFGRYLAVINLNDVCINDKMLQEGYAVEYFGEKR